MKNLVCAFCQKKFTRRYAYTEGNNFCCPAHRKAFRSIDERAKQKGSGDPYLDALRASGGRFEDVAVKPSARLKARPETITARSESSAAWAV